MSLAAVFIPILFMGGILGRLFREFAVTITTAILISGVVSVTLTPMLCSRFLRVVAHARSGFAGLMDAAFDALLARLRVEPRRSCCATGWRCSSCSSRVLVATVQMFGIVPKGFIPDQDNDTLNVNLRAAQGTSFYDMVEVDAAGRRHRHQEPVRRLRSWRASAARRRRSRHEQRPHATCSWCRARERAAIGAADRPAAPAAAAALPGLPRVRQPAAGAADRRPHGQQQLQPDGAEPEHRRALRVGARARAGDRRSCPRCRTSRPTWR